MKHSSESEQLTLFTVAPTQRQSVVHDPYWDEITNADDDRWNPDDFGEVPRKADGDQLTIFYDDSHEPPDPDDYQTHQEYEQAWNQWESVREQVNSNTQQLDQRVREQLNNTSKVAPEHAQWVEKYWVKRSGKKHYYYRYCWMHGRKIQHCHIPGTGSTSPTKFVKVELVESAIADGKLPMEIEKLIQGLK